MAFNFVCDRRVGNRAYPALAQHQAEPYTPGWREYLDHWPQTVPCELIEHCQSYDFPYNLWTTEEDYPDGSLYLIGIGFFNFTVDYFGLMTDTVRTTLRSGRLLAMFYYHEGDNPWHIQARLNSLCQLHNLPVTCYRFVSGNSAADQIPNFFFFPDHELLYHRRNKDTPALPIHSGPRSRDFTVLSRTHKWWRASIMSDLHRNQLLANSYWSYSTDVSINEDPADNPIEVDELNLHRYMQNFLAGAPYTCDTLSSEQHNDHSLVEPKHYQDSYCNIILETLYDTDNSGGAFLTEKTFKVIKHGQPFVIAGAPGSVAALGNIGFRLFHHAVDHSYDLETDPTRRWQLLFREIARIKDLDLPTWFESCREDIEFNQRLFSRSRHRRLNSLFIKLINS